MKKSTNTVLFSLLLSAFSAAAAAPKIGVTLSFKGTYGSEMYISNAHFKERPIAKEFAQRGLDLCWYMGWGKRQEIGNRKEGIGRIGLESLKQFNAIWLTTDHETMCPYSPEETAAAMKAYLESGGGIVVSHSIGRYPEAPVDAFWKKVMRAFDMELIHEQVADYTRLHEVDKYYDLFYCDNLAKHPVTEGLAGVWCPLPKFSNTWGAMAAKYSADWTVLVATGPGGRSYVKDRITNMADRNKIGFYDRGNAPIVACRQVGKGRLVFSAIHKDNSGWMYNIDRWPNFVECGTFDGKRSDGLKLLENALRWAVEPSLADRSFTANYKPVEPDEPPYYRQPDFAQVWNQKPEWPKGWPQPGQAKPLAAGPVAAGPLAAGAIAAGEGNGVRGLIGLHSNYSDGESTVAEYVAAAKRAGLGFLVFTDPLAALGKAEQLEKLRQDCAANSTDDFYCCPGVEFVDLSGLEWIVFADKVSFPPEEPMLRDGRYYRLFENGVMRQPRMYRCKNLYRGALLNNKRLKEIGNFDVNLFWSNQVVPVAFDVDRVLYDNFPEFLAAGENVRRTSTISYTRVKRAADVARAAKASTTVFDDFKKVQPFCNAEGNGSNSRQVSAHGYVKLGEGVEIRGFDFMKCVPGTDKVICTLRVTSPAGLKEIRIEDSLKRTLARFDPRGETEFATTFTFDFDTQSYPQLIATDRNGDRAVSCANWIWWYHAGLARCGDNANLLAMNPTITMYVNRDMELTPIFKALRPEAKHYHLSEAHFWEKFDSAKSGEPSFAGRAVNTLRLHGVDFPSEEKNVMPSSRTVFSLVQPNTATIVDQYQGEWLVEPTRTEKNGTYSYCSMPPKVGENEYWRVRHRTYQFCDNVDIWWSAVYQRNAPDYRGGYTIVEGEIEFLMDARIYVPFELMRTKALNPRGRLPVYGKRSGAFLPGDYYAAVPGDKAWYGVVALKGNEAVNISERKIADGVETVLTVGKRDQRVKKGDKLRYRVAFGSFNENSHGEDYIKWFADMMNGEGFNHVAKKGEITGVNGIVEVAAEANEAVIELGPCWFIQRYPVMVSGLVDNGSAVAWDGGRHLKPLGFEGGRSYVELPLEKRRTWRLMNLYIANEPTLRFSVVPAMPGHERETVEIHNPTTRDVKTKVRDVRAGRVFEVEVAAGSTVVAEPIVGAETILNRTIGENSAPADKGAR